MSSSPPYSPPCNLSPGPLLLDTCNFDTIDDSVVEPSELWVQYMFLSNDPPPSKRARLEDQDTTTASSARLPKRRYWEKYPHPAGSMYGFGRMTFESWMKKRMSKWEPFRSQEEWDLAKWLVKHTGHGGINELLGLDIVSH